MANSLVPRPEYPRPRLVRDRWQSLNGLWEFAFDPQDAGAAGGWQDHLSLDDEICVPFAHQTKLSCVGDRQVCEVVWYAQNFEMPDDWTGETILLHFGAVDYEATVWLNGALLGIHRGGHVPFTFDATLALKGGENRVSLRVVDRQDPGQPRGKQASSGQSHGIDYWCTTGIWQSVWLEPVGPSYLADLVVTSDLGSFHVEPLMYGARNGVEARIEVFAGDVKVAERIGAGLIPVPDPKLWSPDSPSLYDLRITLTRDGETLDEVRSYAGLRTVELRDGQFLLNGEPLFLKMVLDQGYWPDGGLTAPSDEALKADVEWCKALGFNGARKHQKIEDPRWLAWCDRLGLLVWGEMPNARAWSPEVQRMLEEEWTEAVLRDRSHPCIVAWVPLNESMGFPDLEAGDSAQRAGMERLVHLTRRLDPTRPVIDNDGWEQSAVSDIVAVHDYSHSGAELAARYADSLPERIWSGSRCTLLPGVEASGRPIMLTEVGGFLTRPEDAGELDVMYSIYNSIGSGEELLTRYEELMAGIAEVPFVAGFCYTQLTDVEQERNGLLTYDRRPKVEPFRIAPATGSARPA